MCIGFPLYWVPSILCFQYVGFPVYWVSSILGFQYIRFPVFADRAGGRAGRLPTLVGSHLAGFLPILGSYLGSAGAAKPTPSRFNLGVAQKRQVFIGRPTEGRT